MQNTLKFIAADAHLTGATGQNVVTLGNDADPRVLALDGITRIDLHFPKFTDGRAYSQAFLLRRRLGFTGELRATGDVLVDQVLQMQRSGFDSAVLRADQNVAHAQRQLSHFTSFYQGDAVTHQSLFGTADHRVEPAPPAERLPTDKNTHMSAINLNARASAEFAQKLDQTEALLQQAALDYAPTTADAAPRIALACSLGAEDMVLVHLINSLQLNIGIFVLETGQLHPETLSLLERLTTSSKAFTTVFTPKNEAVVQFVTHAGKNAMYQSMALRKACCQIRKMEPLSRALAGKAAWITGLRREQSGARAEVPLIDTSAAERVKLNPLADWTWGDVWHFIALNNIDYNPLHDQFFPSIGCAPCTRAISAGEDFRAGRWWWEDEAAKECGLHVKDKS